MFFYSFSKYTRFAYTTFFIFLSITPFVLHTKHDSHYFAENHTLEQLCMCDFCQDLMASGIVEAHKIINHKHYAQAQSKSKPNKVKANKRTIIVYMAADNDLRVFAARNIQQMAAVGSNENATILVHLDIRLSGNKKITRRYLIEKEKVLHVDPYDIFTQQMDSGNPATLISCCEWAIKNYPAQEYDLILWNHGTGVLEPPHGKIINPMDLFVFNPTTHLLELDRSIGFMDAMNRDFSGQRGICWDDTTGNYLTNKKLDLALETIRQKHLDGKKFGIIGFDACLMMMTEVGSFIQKHAHIMTGSQEVELGMGWKYDDVLSLFIEKSLDRYEFARHIVESYDKTYQPITYDYTLSAIHLKDFVRLEKTIHDISNLLLEGLGYQKTIFSRVIAESRNKHTCTHFDEPSYVDLHHLFSNLSNCIQRADLSSSRERSLKNALLAKLSEGKILIESMVIANTAGRNLKNARGISIYFPERNIHSSYREAAFLETNNWGKFLVQYLFH